MLTSGIFSTTPETQKVMNKLSGHKTAAERIKEFYGLQDDDLFKAKKLKEMGVKHNARLQELGVSKEAFDKLFADILDDDGDNGQGAGESYAGGLDGNEGNGGVENPANPVKGSKGKPRK